MVDNGAGVARLVSEGGCSTRSIEYKAMPCRGNIEPTGTDALLIVLVGINIGPEKGIDTGLIAFATILEPLQHVGVDAQGHLLFAG